MHTTGSQRLRVHRFLAETEVEGPGRRAALWVQGCPIRCPGCANGATWAFDGGCQTTVESVFNQIQAQRGIEGVTFIGGEPFSQAGALAALGLMCRKHGLSVVTFTGYEYSRLLALNRPDWNALLGVTDLLLAGPFVEAQKDFTRPWVGSRNQEFIFLTQRYRHLQTQAVPSKNGLEILISPSGNIRLNGLASLEDIFAMRLELTSLGLKTT